MKILNKLITLKYFSLLLKTFVLVFLILLIYIGFQAHSTESSFLKQLRNFNFANLIVWSYWWPFLVVSSIFFGRIWCMICPVELITTVAAKFGLKKERPQWLKTGWAITLLYIFILFIGINGFAIHRSPKYMAIYLILLVALSVLIGLIYKKNTFCKYVCPIGILLSIYSRFSFLGWRVQSTATCQSCKDKSCICNTDTYKINDKSCGVGLYPAKITSNADCILCGGCRKACKNNNPDNTPNRPNPGFVKISLKKGLFLNPELTYSQVAFTLILSGFIIYEILSEWSVTKGILMYVPNMLNQQFDLSNSILKGLMKSIVLFIILPSIIWTLPFLISKLSKVKVSLRDYLKNFAAAFIPIMAAGHLCKALLKTTSRIPYFEHVFSDLNGLDTTQAFLNGTISLFKIGNFPQLIISISLITLTITGIIISILTVKRINNSLQLNNGYIFNLIPILYGLIFFISILFWRFI